MVREELIKKITNPKENHVYLTDEEVHHIIGDWVRQHFNIEPGIETVESFKQSHIKVTVKK